MSSISVTGSIWVTCWWAWRAGAGPVVGRGGRCWRIWGRGRSGYAGTVKLRAGRAHPRGARRGAQVEAVVAGLSSAAGSAAVHDSCRCRVTGRGGARPAPRGHRCCCAAGDRDAPPGNSNGARAKGVGNVRCQFRRGSPALQRLSAHQVRRAGLRLRVRQPVVSARRAGHFTNGTVHDLVGRLRERTGIAFAPHTFRHTYATELLRRKVPVEVVSRDCWGTRRSRRPATPTPTSRWRTPGGRWSTSAGCPTRTCRGEWRGRCPGCQADSGSRGIGRLDALVRPEFPVQAPVPAPGTRF